MHDLPRVAAVTCALKSLDVVQAAFDRRHINLKNLSFGSL